MMFCGLGWEEFGMTGSTIGIALGDGKVNETRWVTAV